MDSGWEMKVGMQMMGGRYGIFSEMGGKFRNKGELLYPLLTIHIIPV